MIGCVVLAAGGGSRFLGSTHKLVAPFRGGTVVGHALAAAVAAGVGQVAVVTGAVAIDAPEGVVVLHNDRWADGQASSLQCALRWAAALGLEAVVVGLGDAPLVTPEAWRAIASADATPIATARSGGQRHPPVRLVAAVWPLLPAMGDEGARAVMRARPDLVTEVEVAAAGAAADIDTAADLERWR
ncbi:MAG: hypothetical protein JWN46_2441 [Acidimicrobiales bacterium]|nr:hypothetical protein [Acidimicrobiales bacterium]